MKLVVGFLIGFILGQFLTIYIGKDVEAIKEFGEAIDNFCYAIAALLLAISQLIKSWISHIESKSKQEKRLKQTSKEAE